MPGKWPERSLHSQRNVEAAKAVELSHAKRRKKGRWRGATGPSLRPSETGGGTDRPSWWPTERAGPGSVARTHARPVRR